MLAFSSELPRGGLLTRRFAGDEYVVFRTADGAVTIAHAYCPHLGAHLGAGGAVVGNALRCPFHAFEFASDGRCVATAYAGRRVPRLCLRTLPCREKHGMIFGWHERAGAPPDFEIPEMDMRGWSSLRTDCISTTGHPIETGENSVDGGHFGAVHGYPDLEPLAPPIVDGPHLHVRYGMSRRFGVGRLGVMRRFEIEAHLHGLGYAQVQTWVPSLHARTRHFVLPTPTGAGEIDLRLATSTQRLSAPPAARWATALLAEVANLFAGHFYRHDVSQDLRFWQTKRHLPRPGLADGDGPIGLYRKWARQFEPYGPGAEAEAQA